MTYTSSQCIHKEACERIKTQAEMQADMTFPLMNCAECPFFRGQDELINVMPISEVSDYAIRLMCFLKGADCVSCPFVMPMTLSDVMNMPPMQDNSGGN